MPVVGFGPMIPMFERAKTVHALDPFDKGKVEMCKEKK
jgi:hypothetical protein